LSPPPFSLVPDFGLGGEEVRVDGLPFPRNETVIRILVADNGEGIQTEHLQKIFDPFFTTREPGKGTGLGLAICNRIIESYGGAVIVRSQPNKGSAFLILIPAKGKFHA